MGETKSDVLPRHPTSWSSKTLDPWVRFMVTVSLAASNRSATIRLNQGTIYPALLRLDAVGEYPQQ
jgi:hypothetical protein